MEELEAIRLKDLDGLEQEAAAERMGVSRPTFQRILEHAHRNVAEGLVMGKALRIEGGDYEVVPMQFHCRRCGHHWEQMATDSTLACPNCEGQPPEPQQQDHPPRRCPCISKDQ